MLCFYEGITHQGGKEACTTLQVPTAEDLASLPPLPSAEDRGNELRHQGQRKEPRRIAGKRFVRCPWWSRSHEHATQRCDSWGQNADRQPDPAFAGSARVYLAQTRATWATVSQRRSTKFSPLYRRRCWVDGAVSQAWMSASCDYL